jgi:hypothetical protein
MLEGRSGVLGQFRIQGHKSTKIKNQEFNIFLMGYLYRSPTWTGLLMFKENLLKIK